MSIQREQIRIRLDFPDRTIDASASVPKTLLRPADLVPILLGITDAVVAVASDVAESTGRRVSCKNGCGACCRQLVPISEAEALYLAELVEEMPPERRDEVQRRFREALEALGAPLVEQLHDTASVKDAESKVRVGLEYFRVGVACPFLVDESCSIHRHRPAACREYLVTNPAEDCWHPGPGIIQMVPLPVKPSVVMFHFDDGIGNHPSHWMPLVLALEYAEARKGTPQPTFDAPQMLRNFVAQLRRWQGRM